MEHLWTTNWMEIPTERSQIHLWGGCTTLFQGDLTFPKMSCHWHSRQWMHLHFMRLLQQIKLLCCCQTDQDNVSLTSCCVRFCTAIIAHNTEMQHIVWMELTWDFCDVFWQGCSSDIRIVLCNHTGKLLISQTTPRCCWLFETIILAIYFGKS